MSKEEMKNVKGGGELPSGNCTLVCYMYEGLELGTVDPVGCAGANDDLLLQACLQFWPNDAQAGECICGV